LASRIAPQPQQQALIQNQAAQAAVNAQAANGQLEGQIGHAGDAGD